MMDNIREMRIEVYHSPQLKLYSFSQLRALMFAILICSVNRHGMIFVVLVIFVVVVVVAVPVSKLD